MITLTMKTIPKIRLKSLCLSYGLGLVLALAAFVQPLTPVAALKQFFMGDKVQAAWFADDFLAQVPLTQIETLRQQITDQLGVFERVEGDESPFTVIFAQGSATAEITLDEAGKIAGLRITQPQQATDPREAAPATTPKAALEQLFTTDTIEEAWFSDAFLAQVPFPQIETLLTQLIQAGGDFQQVEGEASPFTVRFAAGQTTATITLDSAGRITELFFEPLIPLVDAIDAAIEQFAALPGEVSVLVLKNGEEAAALNADARLAIGSAFKLSILTALRAQIEAGTHSWDEIIPLAATLKSLPGGMLQDWPDR